MLRNDTSSGLSRLIPTFHTYPDGCGLRFGDKNPSYNFRLSNIPINISWLSGMALTLLTLPTAKAGWFDSLLGISEGRSAEIYFTNKQGTSVYHSTMDGDNYETCQYYWRERAYDMSMCMPSRYYELPEIKDTTISIMMAEQIKNGVCGAQWILSVLYKDDQCVVEINPLFQSSLYALINNSYGLLMQMYGVCLEILNLENSNSASLRDLEFEECLKKVHDNQDKHFATILLLPFTVLLLSPIIIYLGYAQKSLKEKNEINTASKTISAILDQPKQSLRSQVSCAFFSAAKKITGEIRYDADAELNYQARK